MWPLGTIAPIVEWMPVSVPFRSPFRWGAPQGGRTALSWAAWAARLRSGKTQQDLLRGRLVDAVKVEATFGDRPWVTQDTAVFLYGTSF